MRSITSLRGKPKFFAFQSCQGPQNEYGEKSRKIEEDRHSKQKEPGFTSNNADTIILYATVPGMVSYR